MTAAPADYAGRVHKYGKFEVNEFVAASDFAMVNFNKNDLDTAYSQNTAIIATIGHLLGRAKRQTANFKTRRDAVKAKVSRRIRDELVSAKTKVTNDAVEERMRTDQEFLEVSFAENHAIEVEETIDALYWAARGRRNDMEFFADKERAERSARNFTGTK